MWIPDVRCPIPDIGYMIRDARCAICDVRYGIRDMGFGTWNLEYRGCFVFVVQRMLDDPIVAPDAESQRDEEIRGNEAYPKPEVP